MQESRRRPQQSSNIPPRTEDQHAQRASADSPPNTDRLLVEEYLQAADGHACAQQTGEQRNAQAEPRITAAVEDHAGGASQVGAGGEQLNERVDEVHVIALPARG